MTLHNSCCVMHCLRWTCRRYTSQHAIRRPVFWHVEKRVATSPQTTQTVVAHTSTAKGRRTQERLASTVLVETDYGCAGNAASGCVGRRLGAENPHACCC